MRARPERVRSVRVSSLGSFWVLRDFTLSDLEALLRAHRESVEEGRWLKHNRGSVVTQVAFGPRELLATGEEVSSVVIKQSALAWRRRLGHRLGAASRFCRDFEVFDRLSALGIASPQVLGTP